MDARNCALSALSGQRDRQNSAWLNNILEHRVEPGSNTRADDDSDAADASRRAKRGTNDATRQLPLQNDLVAHAAVDLLQEQNVARGGQALDFCHFLRRPSASGKRVREQ